MYMGAIHQMCLIHMGDFNNICDITNSNDSFICTKQADGLVVYIGAKELKVVQDAAALVNNLLETVRAKCQVCCSVLQGVAGCCSVLQCGAVWCSVLQSVAVRCSVLQSVAVCCSLLQSVAVCCRVVQSGAGWHGVLQCVAVWGSMGWLRSVGLIKL